MIEVIVKCSDECRGSKNVYGEPITEIVRCKDCKWQSTVHDADDNSNYYMCGVHAQPTDPYAFCSYGERRSE